MSTLSAGHIKADGSAPCPLDFLVRPSTVIRNAAPTPAADRLGAETEPGAGSVPVAASSAASARLSQYSDDSGEWLSGMSLEGCLSNGTRLSAWLTLTGVRRAAARSARRAADGWLDWTGVSERAL